MKNRKTGKAIAAAAMLTIAAMTMPMQTVSAEDIVDDPYNVVVLGDSISTGYGLEDSSKSYVSVLEHHMNQKVTNLAKDGTTSSELLQSLQGDSTMQSAVAGADIIVVTIGANDILQPVLNNDVVKVDDYDNVYDLANAIKDNQIAFQKYLRANMPTAVANANTNIDSIILQLKSTNDHAKLVFQTVYDPLSVDQDDTGLSSNALSMLSTFSNGQMYQYLNGSANGGTYIPVGLNQNLQTHAQNGEIYLADVYNIFLHHAWTNVNIANADVHPTATGHAAIANLLIDSGYFPTVTNTAGDIDGDGNVAFADAVAVLTEYARVAAGNEAQFNPAQKKSADVNGDGMIDVSDAVGILVYYAKQAAGQTPSFNP